MTGFSKKSRTSLSSYMNDIGRHPLLTPEEERDLAIKIHEQKIDYWKALLSHPPVTESVLDRLESIYDNKDHDFPAAEVAALRRATVAYRQRDTKVNADDFANTCRLCAIAIAKIDADGLYSEDILVNLKKLEKRDRSVEIHTNFPPAGSRRFFNYMKRIQESGSQLEQLRNRFIKSNLRLVVSVARRYGSSMAMMDLIQEGNMGLMKAVDRFNPNLGRRFSTYAIWWIRHNINRSIADKSRVVRIPVHISADLHKIRKISREYEAQHGRLPDQEVLAKALGVGIKRIRNLQRVHDGHISLDSFESEYNRDLLDLIHGLYHPLSDKRTSSKSEIEDSLENQESVEILREVLDELRPLERKIIYARFGIDDEEYMTLRELGERHDLSRERIRQIEGIALLKLRKAIERAR